MGRHPSGSSFADFSSVIDLDHEDSVFQWPFGKIESLDQDELRETAYELFFTSCRSAPGFGGRNPPTYYSSSSQQDDGKGNGGGGGGGANMVVSSRVKRALGLRTRRAPPQMRAMRESPMRESPSKAGANSPGKVKQRPMTSAEIMRQQMGVTEQSDNRLRKTLMRALVGQMGRRAESIILPLELLRQLKPSEFADPHEYHHWQRRQLKVLEAGLSLHPSTPLDRLNASALRLREVVRSSDLKPIDTSKSSDAMRTLSHSVLSLAWRSSSSPSTTTATDVCHWADGFPLNLHLYLSLLRAVFDLRDDTVILDEVDELLELMKKTWTALGLNRTLHNACFAWVLFQQYVVTGQVEPDLIGATLAMLTEVATDAKRFDRDPGSVKILSATLSSMQGWAERKLLEYHEGFEKGAVGMMENVLCLALSTAKIIGEDLSGGGGGGGGGMLVERDNGMTMSSLGNRVDQYIRSSLKSAFTKIFENGNGKVDSMVVEVDEDPNEVLMQLSKETEELAVFERETFSPILRRWHPVPTAVAVVTLHNCFGIVLKQYLARITSLSNESVRVLQAAGKLEKILVQMVVEDSADCDDGGKGIVREMIPYEVDSVIQTLMKNWITARLRIGRECLNRAKETESWNPKSKSEPYAQSAVDLMKLGKVTVDEFFAIPVGVREELVQDLADGLDALFQDYTSFVASCGTKQSYIPSLPPLTRCNQDPKFLKLWKLAAPCKAGISPSSPSTTNSGGAAPNDSHHIPRPSTSRGTQRLYVRLNTLHYLLAHVHSIDKSLSFFSSSSSSHRPGGAATTKPSPSPSRASPHQRRRIAPTHFDLARSSIQTAILHVSEVAAYRLIFIDSNHSFYDGLYLNSVAAARIKPALRTLKQNLTLLVAVLTDRAQPLAVREVMKASFEAFLMVLLAGGSGRAFGRSDYEMVVEDFESLKRVFCTCGEGLVAEEVVEREAEAAERIVELMGVATEKLVEDFSAAACEASGMGGMVGPAGSVQRVPMPPTTGRWSRSDPNTLLRVICHRNDDAASWFLKKTFQLAKRR